MGEEKAAQEASEPNALVRAWRTVRARWWSRWLMDGLIILAVMAAVMSYQARHLISSGEAAPAFTLTDMEGTQRSLSDYRGEKVLLAFWSPWCSVCGMEMGNLEALHESDGVEVVTVALGYERIEDVQKFIAEHDVKFPVLLGNRETQQAYNIKSFPTLYVIDSDGEIEDSVVGYTTEIGLRMRILL